MTDIDMALRVLMSAIIGFTLSHLAFRGGRGRLIRLIMRETTPLGWLGIMLISLAVSVASYVLMPKPKGGQPGSTQELDDPVAEAGKPVAVCFGTMTNTELNVLWFGDKSIRTIKVKVS